MVESATHLPVWHSLESAEAVAAKAMELILTSAEQAIASRGRFSLVLAGGSTPERCYRLLATAEADWSRWHIYFGDERCLPPDHPQRNSRMAELAFIGQVPIPEGQIHPIPAESGNQAGADAYQREISDALPFDLVLLGIGEDGHTASLFPGQSHPPEPLVVAVQDAPKPPPQRISLNYSALRQSRQLIFLITGEGKRDALLRWQQGEPIPAALVASEGRLEVFSDLSL
jgi:6-phosphogluconolactonase